MHVLAIYRHYWPDTAPYSRILRAILESHTAGGGKATIFTAQPGTQGNYPPRSPRHERLAGVTILRTRLLPEKKSQKLRRAVNFCYFLLRSILHAVNHRQQYDLLLANTHPPILMGCTLRLIRWLTGMPYLYHVQDIHPECLLLAGALQPGWLSNRLQAIDAATCRDARDLVVLSEDMQKSLAARGRPMPRRITVLNNAPPTVEQNKDACSPRHVLPGHSRHACFLFAGNLGNFQDLDLILESLSYLEDRLPLRLVFMGEGAAKARLIRKAGLRLGKSVFFLPHQPMATALSAMRTADYGILSLLPGVTRFAYPSKSMAYFTAGCPVVGMLEPESGLARTIARHRLGFIAAKHTPQAVAELFSVAVARRSEWTPQRREAIVRTCGELFEPKKIDAAWSHLLAQPEVVQANCPSATYPREAA